MIAALSPSRFARMRRFFPAVPSTACLLLVLSWAAGSVTSAVAAVNQPPNAQAQALTMYWNRTNDIVKVLTIYGTIALPLIVITGFYGMNLGLPLQHSPYGLWLVVAMMLVSVVAVLWYFRRRDWM